MKKCPNWRSVFNRTSAAPSRRFRHGGPPFLALFGPLVVMLRCAGGSQVNKRRRFADQRTHRENTDLYSGKAALSSPGTMRRAFL